MSDETATVSSAQDVNSAIEARLYGEPEKKEPEVVDNEEVSDDGESLPDDTTSEDESDTGEEEDGKLEDIASEEDLTLANYLGLEEDRLSVNDDGSVTFNAIVDGESKQVPLKELASSFQLQGHVNNKSIKLEEEKKEFAAKQEQIGKEIEDRVKGIAGLSKVLEDNLVKEFDSIDWNRLRDESPAEWSALRQEFAEKAQQIQQAQGLIKQEAERVSQESQQRNHLAQQEYLQDQMSKVVANNPTWADEAVRKAEQGKIKTFLESSYGFGEGDLDGISDHRAIRVIQDAMAYRNGKKAATIKKNKSVPKFAKPGASKAQSASTANARAVKAKRATLKKSGKVRDAADLILSRM